MTFANNLDPDEAPQNVGLHLRSKLFDIQIIYSHKKLVRNKYFLQILKKKIFKKNYPACKELTKDKMELFKAGDTCTPWNNFPVIYSDVYFLYFIELCSDTDNREISDSLIILV